MLDAPSVRLGLFDPQPRQIRLDFADPRRRRRLALARLSQPRPRRLDRLRQLAVAPREQHLLPPTQLFAQPLVAARLRRLALERTALLFDLEDDVVDAGEVLLRRLELQLRGAAAGLVLRDARGLLDQLTTIRRPRAEDHPDLALLDDRVGLGAEPGVHHQFVDVAQAAHLAVDQVFALAGPVQTTRDLDVAREGERNLLERRVVDGHGHYRCHCRCRCRSNDRWSGRPSDRCRQDRPRGTLSGSGTSEAGVSALDGRPRQSRQAQAHLGGGAGLAGIAAVEDDVFHLLAAQALGALLAEHPRNGVGDVALAAAVGADDGGDALVEGQLRAVGKRLEAGNLETFEAHCCPHVLTRR